MAYILGIDLSGPSNAADTVAVLCRSADDGLRLVDCVRGADDPAIIGLAGAVPADALLVAGLDAPLSYNVGGGDRAADAQLRALARRLGLSAGTVMAPTMTRMAYLTLRGIAVARLLARVRASDLRIVEVHPASTLALCGAPVEHVRNLKTSVAARRALLDHLEAEGLVGVAAERGPSDHFVAAAACALAAWRWHAGRPAWVFPADPPHHPYDFAC